MANKTQKKIKGDKAIITGNPNDIIMIRPTEKTIAKESVNRRIKEIIEGIRVSGKPHIKLKGKNFNVLSSPSASPSTSSEKKIYMPSTDDEKAALKAAWKEKFGPVPHASAQPRSVKDVDPLPNTPNANRNAEKKASMNLAANDASVDDRPLTASGKKRRFTYTGPGATPNLTKPNLKNFGNKTSANRKSHGDAPAYVEPTAPNSNEPKKKSVKIANAVAATTLPVRLGAKAVGTATKAAIAATALPIAAVTLSHGQDIDKNVTKAIGATAGIAAAGAAHKVFKKLSTFGAANPTSTAISTKARKWLGFTNNAELNPQSKTVKPRIKLKSKQNFKEEVSRDDLNEVFSILSEAHLNK